MCHESTLKALEEELAKLGEVTKILQEDLRMKTPQEGATFKFVSGIFDDIDNLFIEIVSKDMKLLYINKAARAHLEKLGYRPEVGTMCYSMRQGIDKPCDHCNVIDALHSRTLQRKLWTGASGTNYWSVTIPMLDNGSTAVLHLFYVAQEPRWDGAERRGTHG